MTRLILASLVLAISILALYAQSTSLHTDRSGYTAGTDGNRTVNTYTDRYGNTTGWVGGKDISTYSDGHGGTTGTIGNKRITSYEDSSGSEPRPTFGHYGNCLPLSPPREVSVRKSKTLARPSVSEADGLAAEKER